MINILDTLKPGGILILDRSVSNKPNRDDINIYTIPILDTANE